MFQEAIQFRDTLNSATTGLEWGEEIVRRLSAGQSVEIDLSRVHRVTPSFANALVLTVLHAHPAAMSAGTLRFEGPAHVSQAFIVASDRYERGIRLSTQRT